MGRQAVSNCAAQIRFRLDCSAPCPSRIPSLLHDGVTHSVSKPWLSNFNVRLFSVTVRTS